MSRLTVGILSWNRADAIEIALNSVKKQNIFEELEVLVLDNNSKDNTVDIIREKFPWVQLHLRTSNSGLAEGRNILVRMANSPIVFWMDDDCELVENNCLENLLIEIENNKKLGVVYGKILEGGEEGDAHISPPADLSEIKKKFENIPMYPATFASGGTCVNKEVFLKLGGYDSDFFRMGVENCFSYKLFREDYIIKYNPKSTIIHRPHKSGRDFKVITFYSFRNKLTANWRYLPLLPAMIVSLFDFFLILGGSLKDKDRLIGFFKGFIAFLVKFPEIFIFQRKPMKQNGFTKWAYSRHYLVNDLNKLNYLKVYSTLNFLDMEFKTRVGRRFGWKREKIYL